MTVWPASSARQPRRDRRRLFCQSIPGTSAASSSTASLCLHIVIVDPRILSPFLNLLARKIRQACLVLHAFSAADFLVFWIGGGCTVRANVFPVVEIAGLFHGSVSRACGRS